MHICQSSDINQILNACLKKQFHWLLTVLYRTGMPLDGNLCKIFKLSLNFISIECENFYLLDQDKKCLITQSIKPLKSFISDSGFFLYRVPFNCLF